MTAATRPGRTPRFSIVVAVYNVGLFLDEFIESVEKQTFPLDDVEVVLVNDGSTDNSLAILEAWQKRRPELVTVVSQPNAGVATTRNVGLDHAHGEWVTMTDPDDVLDEHFLEEVDRFLREQPQTQLVATNRVVFDNATREQSKHPLHRHFHASSNKLRNLTYDTGHFHGHAASSFFRLDEIRRASLRFSEQLSTTFEDGHFCTVYLMEVDEPLVGYLPNARYNYRRRGDGTSLLDRSWADPGRFTDVVEHGFLDLLRRGVERYGRAPSWVQGMVLYELSWYFRQNEKSVAPEAAHGETLVRFHELMEQVCSLLDETGIQTYRITTFQATWREILRHGYAGERWHASYAFVDKLDAEQRLMRVRYRYAGEAPDEVLSVGGKRVDPVHGKIRDIRFYDRTVLYERVVWLPLGTVRVVLDGHDVDMRTEEPGPGEFRLTQRMLKRALDPDAAEAAKRPGRPLTSGEKAVLRLARTWPVRWYFRNAWVLIDRIFNADDSAEHVFRFLRTRRREINAWFVIERGTPDYQRLRRDGFRRVVPHGSLVWKLLMLNAQHLISSHADDVLTNPEALRGWTERRWRFTFLQHGVMKDDLSTWLDRKDIDLFVTSTRAELESVVADHTTYRYTTREAKLTGLPRFDRILEEGERYPPEKRDLVLIAPTWRRWLSAPDTLEGGRHAVNTAEFRRSEFARLWTEVINDPQLKEAAEQAGARVAALLHPNLQDTARLDLAPHVQVMGFEGHNIQEIFARARVLVTDYSSMFFNASYIERPVVYFQFDRERVLAGGHVGRRGYFDYERDGFGPVTFTAAEAVAAITKTVENGPVPDPVYLERIRTAFPERDGRCRERVVQAIVASTRPAAGQRRRAGGRGPGLARRVARRLLRRERPRPVVAGTGAAAVDVAAGVEVADGREVADGVVVTDGVDVAVGDGE